MPIPLTQKPNRITSSVSAENSQTFVRIHLLPFENSIFTTSNFNVACLPHGGGFKRRLPLKFTQIITPQALGEDELLSHTHKFSISIFSL